MNKRKMRKRIIAVAIAIFALMNVLACDIQTDMDRGWQTATSEAADCDFDCVRATAQAGNK